jgi:hypothetical protein
MYCTVKMEECHERERERGETQRGRNERRENS